MKQLLVFLFLFGSIGGIQLIESKENCHRMLLLSFTKGSHSLVNNDRLVACLFKFSNWSLNSRSSTASIPSQHLHADANKINKPSSGKHRRSESLLSDLSKYSKINRLTGIRKYFRSKNN